MLTLTKYLAKERIETLADYASKKRVIEALSMLLTPDNDPELTVYILNALNKREKLGSTALGHGIAIPHARLAGITTPVISALTLQEGIPFDAPDDKPVSLFIALLVPEEDTDKHLALLANLTKILKKPDIIEALKAAKKPKDLYNTLLLTAATHD